MYPPLHIAGPLHGRLLKSAGVCVLQYVIVQDRLHEADDVLRQHRRQEKKFVFDQVFDETESQESVYNLTTSFLIDGVLEGFNATVFAYGATGTARDTAAASRRWVGMLCNVHSFAD